MKYSSNLFFDITTLPEIPLRTLNLPEMNKDFINFNDLK